MSDPHFVIAQVLGCRGNEFCPHDYGCTDLSEPVLDLPAAEHIHVTRHPDGTITAVPMSEYLGTGFYSDGPTGGDQ